MEKEKEKLKVLFCSDLVVPTGFSTVSHNIIKSIEDEFEITGLGVNYRGDPHEYKFPIFPATNGMNNNIYGVDRLVNILNGSKIDLLFMLNDAWVISYYLDAIKKDVKNKPKIVVYFPVDSECHNKEWYKDFDIVTKAYTYTEFGKRVVNECVPEMEVGIMPHGVDTSTFYKLPETKLQLRKILFGDSAEERMPNLSELFFVFNGNRNQPRKKLDITMKGFSLFARNKPDVRLYMHCGVRDSSIDVTQLARRYKIEDKMIITSTSVGIQRVPVDKLNVIYNACDVGINTGMGEGWGLVNVEHAVTGAVQVVGRHSACEELFNDCGILMENVSDFMFDNSQTVGKLTSPEEVARALEILYRNRKLLAELSAKGMKKFTAPEYQWHTIALKWKDIFMEIFNDSDDSPTPISN